MPDAREAPEIIRPHISNLRRKLSAALAQWTWFVGAIVGYVAYIVLYRIWYGKHHPEIPN